MADQMQVEEPVASGSAHLEQENPPQPEAFSIEPSDERAKLLGRSSSNGTRRSDHQRTGSSAGRSAKGKGKRVNVDFAEPPADEEKHQPVSPIDSDADAEGGRRDSYTNFSRIDSVKRNNSKNIKPQGNASSSGMGVLPTHNEDIQQSNSKSAGRSSNIPATKNDMTALPTHPEGSSKTKQNRFSASTAGSRRLRPPIHQSDLERGDATSSEESAPVPPFSQSVAEDHLCGRRLKDLPPVPSPWLRELQTVSYLIFFSFLGTLARTGLEWLTFYPGAIIVTPVIWANFAGSLLMGFFTEDFQLFQDEWAEPFNTTSATEKRTSKQSRVSKQSRYSGRTTLLQDFERFQKKERTKIKITVPLYTGITIGFCGCFTSFALFARDMFVALSNDTPSPINHNSLPPVGADTINVFQTLPRNGGYSFEAVIAVVITTMAISIGGFVAGQQLALIFERFTPRIPSKFTRLFLDRAVIILGFGCWLGAIFLLIWPPDRPGGPLSAGDWANETWRGIELFSLVFSPLGCLLRYFASKKINSLEPSFPLGTFAVNMLGTAIMAMCYDIQHIGLGSSGIGGGLLGCQALQGIIDGLTGSLTTVSTLVAEICALRRRYAWVYALSTVIGGLALVVVIMGPVRWTVGWSDPICASSYADKY